MNDPALARIRQHGLAAKRETPLERQARENQQKRRRQDDERIARNQEILARASKGGSA